MDFFCLFFLNVDLWNIAKIYAVCASGGIGIHPLANCVRDISCEHGKAHFVHW